jgi:hypothetical protein
MWGVSAACSAPVQVVLASSGTLKPRLTAPPLKTWPNGHVTSLVLAHTRMQQSAGPRGFRSGSKDGKVLDLLVECWKFES